MSEQISALMNFEALGTNCVNCGFRLIGRRNTIGAEICLKIEQQLRNGTLDIDVKDDRIYFMFEGISIDFSEREERLLSIEQMFASEGHVCCEPCGDSNYQGFTLMVAG